MKSGSEELDKLANNCALIGIDPGKKHDKVTISIVVVNYDGTITQRSIYFDIKTPLASNSKLNCGKEPSTEKTGVRKDRIKSTHDAEFEKFYSNWSSLNTKASFQNQSEENLKYRKYCKSALQRFYYSYVHQIFEHYRAFINSLPEDKRRQYSNPPIIAFGTGGGSKKRRNFVSRFITVVEINEYMTSQICPCCLANNKEVVGNIRSHDCVNGCTFQDKGVYVGGVLRVNKDVAAGHNMITILLQMIANGTRRLEFKVK